MNSAQVGNVVRHLRRLAGARPADGPPDADLLKGFAVRRDESAFAALVRRHGPMVLNVCRSVLRHEQDAEDAFQAAFLVLARKAGLIRRPEAVAGWLYEVAHRVALKARAGASRRHALERSAPPTPAAGPGLDMTLRDLHGVLHEELRQLPDKYRLPLVLCYLEGRSQEEAAAQLGWGKGMFRGRLDRGRERLRRRLAARGVGLSALLCAAAAVPTAAAESLVRSAARAAAGAASARAAALAGGVSRALFVGKRRALTGVLLAVGLVAAGAGGLAHQARTAKGPGQPSTAAGEEANSVEVRGRVLGPDGKPFVGARLYLVSDAGPAKVRATSGADGRFLARAPRSEFAGPANDGGWPFALIVATAKDHGPDWAPVAGGKESEPTLRLVRNDVTIRGRVLDLEGKPVAGAVVSVRDLATTPGEDLAPVLKAWRAGQFWASVGLASKSLSDPSAAGLPRRVTAGADGRFRLPGAGRERLVSLTIEAPGIATETIRVVPRPAAEIRALVQAGAGASLRPDVLPSAGPPLYGATFDHMAGPTRLVLGTVRDRKTGRPLAGAEVAGHALGGHAEDVRAVTDDAGHYRLAGLPKAATYRLSARPKEGGDCLPVGAEAAGGDGLGALRVDFAVPHGVEVRGRITDKKTGKPVPFVELRYSPLQGNKHPGVSAYRFTSGAWSADGRGAFRLVLPPGPGAVFAVARNGRDLSLYTQARLAPADKDKAYQGGQPGEALLAEGGRIELLDGTNAYRLLDLAADAKTVTCDLELDPGLTRTGAVLGPDGKPLTGAAAMGLTAVWPRPTPLKRDAFTAVALDPSSPRDLLFIHTGRKLAGRLSLRGDEKETPAVKLEPWGTLAGRLVDADGQPLAGARLIVNYAGRFPAAWEGGPHPEDVRTDREGRFRVEGLVPRLKITLGASAGQVFLLLGDQPNGLIQLSVAAGETKALGDVAVKRAE